MQDRTRKDTTAAAPAYVQYCEAVACLKVSNLSRYSSSLLGADSPVTDPADPAKPTPKE
jgi:hypothetical protein